MRNAIFFDLDGTLTDSGPGIMNSALPALEHFGIPVANRDQLRVFVGPPLRQTFARFGVPEAGIEEAIRIFRARYIPHRQSLKTPPTPASRTCWPGCRQRVSPCMGHFQAPGHRHRGAGALPAGPPLHPDLRGRPAVGRETKADVIAHLLAQIRGPRPGRHGGGHGLRRAGGQGPRHPHHRGHLGYGKLRPCRPWRGGAGGHSGGPAHLFAGLRRPSRRFPSTFLERSPRYGKQ